MGPANTKISKGRGDATAAINQIVKAFTTKDNIAILKRKWELLDEEEKKEVAELLDDADIGELLDDESSIHLFLTDYVEGQQERMFQRLFAFMDAHPLFLEEDQS